MLHPAEEEAITVRTITTCRRLESISYGKERSKVLGREFFNAGVLHKIVQLIVYFNHTQLEFRSEDEPVIFKVKAEHESGIETLVAHIVVNQIAESV